VLNIIL